MLIVSHEILDDYEKKFGEKFPGKHAGVTEAS